MGESVTHGVEGSKDLAEIVFEKTESVCEID